MLWAWAQARANWREPRAEIARLVTARLASVEVDRITSPYVLWRLDQLRAIIGEPDAAVAQPAPPPATLTKPTDLLDLWGYMERCTGHRQLCSSSPTPASDEVINAERDFGDDLSLAAAIGIAAARGNEQAVSTYRMSIRGRRDNRTGLVRSARPQGDIESTFLVLQIAPDLFPGPVPRETAQVMRDDLRRGNTLDVATRMKAVAILRAVNGAGWKDFVPEVRRVINGLRREAVTETSLPTAVELVDALRLVDPSVPQVTLRLFSASDARTRQLARLALANADLFANADQVRDRFRGVTSRLVTDAKTPEDPLVAYYTTINALAGAQVQPDPTDNRRIVEGLRTLQGCSLDGTSYPYLFRSSASARESCSLAATWQAIRSGYAFEATS